MIGVKLKGTVTKNHRLELTMPPSVPSGEVEVIILIKAWAPVLWLGIFGKHRVTIHKFRSINTAGH